MLLREEELVPSFENQKSTFYVDLDVFIVCLYPTFGISNFDRHHHLCNLHISAPPPPPQRLDNWMLFSDNHIQGTMSINSHK